MRSATSTLRGLSYFSFLALSAAAYAQDDWIRHFRIGGSVGMNITTDFKTSGTFPISAALPSAAGGITYDDGFVGVDATGNKNGITTFWGYNSASQKVSATELEFHGTKSFSASGSGAQDDYPLGFDMAYAGTFRQWERLAIGGEFGFGLSAFQARDRRAMSGSLLQRVDRYGTGGTAIPDPPYSGPQSGVGAPVINSTPSPQGDITTPGTIHGNRSLEGILYNFRLGPLLRWQFHPRWTLNASGGGALGIFDAEYEFDEDISANASSSIRNKGKFGTTDLKYGGYAGAIVMYDTGNAWEVYAGAHFMSLQDGKVARDGREATMHLGAAVFITAGINWSY